LVYFVLSWAQSFSEEFREDLAAVAEGQKSLRAAKAEAVKRKITRIKIAVSTAVLG
jgi:hypothetical protein